MKKINMFLISGLSVSMLAISAIGVVGFTSEKNKKLQEQKNEIIEDQEFKDYLSTPRVLETFGDREQYIDENGRSTGGGTIDSPGWANATSINVSGLEEIFPKFFAGDVKGIQTTDSIDQGFSAFINPATRDINFISQDTEAPGLNPAEFKLSSTLSEGHYADYSSSGFNAETDLFLSIKEETADNFGEFGNIEWGNTINSLDEEVTPWSHFKPLMIRDEIQFALQTESNNYGYIQPTTNNYAYVTNNWNDWVKRVQRDSWDQGFHILPQTASIEDAISIGSNWVRARINLPITITSKGGISNIDVSIRDIETDTITKVRDIDTVGKMMGSVYITNFNGDVIDELKPQELILTPDNEEYEPISKVIRSPNGIIPGVIINNSVSSDIDTLKVDGFTNGNFWRSPDKYQVVKVNDGIEEIISEGDISDIIENKYISLNLNSLNNEVSDIKIKYINKNYSPEFPEGLFLGETPIISIDPIKTNTTGNLELEDLHQDSFESTYGKLKVHLTNLSLFDSVNSVRIKSTNSKGEEILSPTQTISNTDESLTIEIELPKDLDEWNIQPQFGYMTNEGNTFNNVQTFETTTDDMENEPENWTTWGNLYKTRIKTKESTYIQDSIIYDKNLVTQDTLSISGAFNIGNNEFGQYKGDETFTLIIKNEIGESQIIESNIFGEQTLTPGEQTFNLENLKVDLSKHGLDAEKEYDIGVVLSRNEETTPTETEVWSDKIEFKKRMLSNSEITYENINHSTATLRTNGFINGNSDQRASKYKITLTNTSNEYIKEQEGFIPQNSELIIHLTELAENTEYNYKIDFYEEDSNVPIRLEPGVIISGNFKTYYKESFASIFNINSSYDKSTNIVNVTWEHEKDRDKITGLEKNPEGFNIILKFKNKEITTQIVDSTINGKSINLNNLITENVITQKDIDKGFEVIVETKYEESHKNILGKVAKLSISAAGIAILLAASYLGMSYIKRVRRQLK